MQWEVYILVEKKALYYVNIFGKIHPTLNKNIEQTN